MATSIVHNLLHTHRHLTIVTESISVQLVSHNGSIHLEYQFVDCRHCRHRCRLSIVYHLKVTINESIVYRHMLAQLDTIGSPKISNVRALWVINTDVEHFYSLSLTHTHTHLLLFASISISIDWYKLHLHTLVIPVVQLYKLLNFFYN